MATKKKEPIVIDVEQPSKKPLQGYKEQPLLIAAYILIGMVIGLLLGCIV